MSKLKYNYTFVVGHITVDSLPLATHEEAREYYFTQVLPSWQGNEILIYREYPKACVQSEEFKKRITFNV